MVSFKKYLAFVAMMMFGIGIILLPFIIFLGPTAIGLAIYALFAKPGKEICQKCRHIQKTI
jgi:hypothetical protein